MNDTPEPSAQFEVSRAPRHIPDSWKLPERLLHPDRFHPCIQDLFDRGPARDGSVSRSTITHFLARWSGSAGLTQEESLAWLSAYATEALATISTSSLNEIRHNTKGIVNFVHRSASPFDCQKAMNPIRCRCDANCPLYSLPPPQKVVPAPPPPISQPVGRVKDFHRERYAQSLQLIRDLRAARCTAPEIVTRLNAEGLPTTTGRKWTLQILNRIVRIEKLGPKRKKGESPQAQAL